MLEIPKRHANKSSILVQYPVLLCICSHFLWPSASRACIYTNNECEPQPWDGGGRSFGMPGLERTVARVRAIHHERSHARGCGEARFSTSSRDRIAFTLALARRTSILVDAIRRVEASGFSAEHSPIERGRGVAAYTGRDVRAGGGVCRVAVEAGREPILRRVGGDHAPRHAGAALGEVRRTRRDLPSGCGEGPGSHRQVRLGARLDSPEVVPCR